VATNVSLTAELETFARSCVESGRYNNVSEVVRSGLRLLQENEERRARFGAMLDEARAEADRDGTHDIEAVAREMDDVIAASRCRRRRRWRHRPGVICLRRQVGLQRRIHPLRLRYETPLLPPQPGS
jgi:antitoxin ParD1/3/4